SRISRHLKVLTECGLLSCRRDGIFVYYHALRQDKNSDLIRFCLQALENEPGCGRILETAAGVIEQRKQRTRTFFNRVANHWEALKRDILGGLDLGAVVLDNIPETRVLVDLGCGTGELLTGLSRKGDKVIGVDSSPEMLARARAFGLAEQNGIELRLGELEHLPLSDREAGAAVLNMVLHHLPVPAAGIREAARVLEPNGLFLITDFAKHEQEEIRKKYGGVWLGFTRNEIEQWLEEAGFVLQDFQEHPVGHGLMIHVYRARKL
ncbi:MAG: methyltransferase domain-containing protein, partial [Thermodesulfobacteriota bacterium]